MVKFIIKDILVLVVGFLILYKNHFIEANFRRLYQYDTAPDIRAACSTSVLVEEMGHPGAGHWRRRERRVPGAGTQIM